MLPVLGCVEPQKRLELYQMLESAFLPSPVLLLIISHSQTKVLLPYLFGDFESRSASWSIAMHDKEAGAAL